MDWPARPYLADNTLHVCDWLDLMQALPDASVDAVICDPPYGMELDEWDKPIDIQRFISEAWRVVKPTGFLAFFQQMPYAVGWLTAMADSEWKFKDHVVWVKRKATGAALPLMRSHESFYIYAKNGGDYHQTKGRYEDVKVPGVAFDVVSIEAIKRHISALHNEGADVVRTFASKEAHKNYQYMPGTGSRAPRNLNFTNVWSFLPETDRKIAWSTKHVSIKPTMFLERACELLTPENGLVIDPFVGSGTTAVAAKITGRRFICGDQSAEYIDIARRRVFPTFGQPPKRKREEKPLHELPLFAALAQ